eukprot:SAG11_NODE_24225_length_376_cov_1.310469_1_plen_93_part_01
MPMAKLNLNRDQRSDLTCTSTEFSTTGSWYLLVYRYNQDTKFSTGNVCFDHQVPKFRYPVSKFSTMHYSVLNLEIPLYLNLVGNLGLLNLVQ